MDGCVILVDDDDEKDDEFLLLAFALYSDLTPGRLRKSIPCKSKGENERTETERNMNVESRVFFAGFNNFRLTRGSVFSPHVLPFELVDKHFHPLFHEITCTRS